ncbi:hypothetical protein [Amycolatopsis sp. NPDC051102]
MSVRTFAATVCSGTDRSVGADPVVLVVVRVLRVRVLLDRTSLDSGS